MIASLKGVVRATGTDHAVVEVGGVGYLVQASARTLGTLEPATPCFLLVETQVREDAITLFGFADGAERDWFRLLTGVQGVGGRLALAILGTLGPDELSRAVTLDDKATIARAPGVGPRLAARIATELKGKVMPGAMPATGLGTAPESAPPPAPATAAAEAQAALEALGFRAPEAARAVAEALRDMGDPGDMGEGAPATPALLREALKRTLK